MKRNPDLIRQLLLLIEDHGVEPLKGRAVKLDGHEYVEIMAHLNLLSDAAFIVAEYSRSSTNPDRIIATEVVFDLSWKGHEYLDSIRDPKIWKKTKALSKKAGSVSFEFLLEIAKGVAREALRSNGMVI